MSTDESAPNGIDAAGQGDGLESVTDPSTTDPAASAAEGGDTGDQGGASAEDSAGGDNGAPESYTDFAFPEGMDVDNAMLEQAAPVFKEIGLNQEQAQQIVDLYGAKMEEMAQGQVDAFTQQVTDWESAAKADKEFGGDKFDENIGVAKLGMDKLGTPELKDFLEKSGAGSHPEVLRAFYRAGKLLREDNPGGGDPSTEKADRVSVLYPDL